MHVYRYFENLRFSPTKTQLHIYLQQAMKYTLYSGDLCKSDEHSLRRTLRPIVDSCVMYRFILHLFYYPSLQVQIKDFRQFLYTQVDKINRKYVKNHEHFPE